MGARDSLWIAALAVLPCACPAEPPELEPEPFALSPVVRDRSAALEAEARMPAIPGADDETRERVEGAVQTRAYASERMLRDIPLDEIRDIGPSAIPLLAAVLASDDRPDKERSVAAELLATLDHPVAAGHLMNMTEKAGEGWLRSQCAWRLGQTTQDRFVPRLVQRLKYEKSPDTFVWIAAALGAFKNYAGLYALRDLAARDGQGESEAALTQLDALAQAAGRNPEDLYATWYSNRAGELPQPNPSPGLRLAVWRRVSELSGEHFQLRGVDDARYVLSSMGPWVAREVADALGDEDLYVRLHVCQVLERMGPRATEAAPALVRALAEPGIAPAAAEALGRVGYPPAERALVNLTRPSETHELRIAATRALGRMGLPESIPVVRALFDDLATPAELRRTAATALVLLDEGDAVARYLLGEIQDDRGDPISAEIALETWLARGTDTGRPDFSAALEAWRTISGPPGVVLSIEEKRELRAERAESLADRIDALVTR